MIEVWYEFASTYSYPATARIESVAAAAGKTIAWKPFLLGPVFARQGWTDSPFNIYAAKGAYMWRDLERTCARMGLPFHRPSVFPRNGVRAARVAIAGANEPWIGAFTRAVYHANFVDDRDISNPDEIERILDGLRLPARDIVDRAESAEHKPKLREQTERAIALGIFGAPTFVVDGELFWGNDRLDEAIAWAS
jgi:2-hydroxychromene-2-carboxylate isomerase